MGWQDVVDGFKLMTSPGSTRAAILCDMAANRRPFDADKLREYVNRGFDPGPKNSQALTVMLLAIKHNVNDAANMMFEMKTVDPQAELDPNGKSGPRPRTGHLFQRKATNAEFLLRAAAEAGNLEMISKLKSLGTRGDLRTLGPSGEPRLFLFDGLWKTEAGKHRDKLLPLLRTFYPDELRQSEELEAPNAASAKKGA